MDSFEEEVPSQNDSESEGGSNSTPYTFNTVEVGVIKEEGLQDFFEKELKARVRPSVLSLAIPDPTVLQDDLKNDGGKQQKHRHSGGSNPEVYATGSKKSRKIIGSDKEDV
jgi:hypothetical protein